MNDKNVRKSHKKTFVVIGILVFLVAVFIYVTVTMSGHWLVKDDEFEHVKWAVILDGQSADLERNDYVANLLAAGRVDSVMILGRRVYRTSQHPVGQNRAARLEQDHGRPESREHQEDGVGSRRLQRI